MHSKQKDTQIQTHDADYLTADDKRKSYQLLKLIQLRIEGLRKDLLNKHFQESERVIPTEQEQLEHFIQEESAIYAQNNQTESLFHHPDLKASLQQLSDQDYQLIEQHFIQGFTLTEIAQKRHVSIQAISQRKRRILKKLRQIMNGG
ncbi:sigma-70 family RNA polymerase sigma factor [Aerococcaceae bacterium NML190073]|nr:sigma-70 family RNA polymerase sigma factor [Aerococcaceae bacterium NML190073]MCW6675484.1 sigma-70 family RNA polymerase sigma factor [Aerococcaceae bacterium NML171108]